MDTELNWFKLISWVCFKTRWFLISQSQNQILLKKEDSHWDQSRQKFSTYLILKLRVGYIWSRCTFITEVWYLQITKFLNIISLHEQRFLSHTDLSVLSSLSPFCLLWSITFLHFCPIQQFKHVNLPQNTYHRQLEDQFSYFKQWYMECILKNHKMVIQKIKKNLGKHMTFQKKFNYTKKDINFILKKHLSLRTNSAKSLMIPVL